MAPVRVVELKILATSDAARAALDLIAAKADALSKLDPTIKVRVDRTALTQGLAILNAETKAAALNLAKVTTATNAATNAGRAAVVVWTRAGGVLGRFSLFGGPKGPFGGWLPGILASVGGVHLLVDTILEVGAVLVPVAIAVGAFGAAAAVSVKGISTQLANVNTVSTATGRAIAPLTGAFQKVSDAVQPKVYQLYGDALTIINSKSGAFQRLAVGTGTVLDQLGARFTSAVTSGTGLSVFMKNAIPDVAGLGNVLGNLGGALGNIIKVMPGYAQGFLTVAGGISRVAEVASAGLGTIIGWGLGLHGVFLYGGLLVTGLLFLETRMKALALSIVTGPVRALQAYIGTIVLADGASASLAAAFAPLLANPFVWVGVAVAALGAFVYLMVTSKSATQQWVASLQKTIDAAPSVIAGTKAIGDAQAQVAQRIPQLVTAQQHLARATDATSVSYGKYGGVLTGGTPALSAATGATAAAVAAMRQFKAEAALSGQRLATLTTRYGSQSAAMGLVNAAGITEKQWLDKSPGAWAAVQLQVASTALAYQDMGQKGGQLGHDMSVLNIEASDQFKAMSSLNSAWDTFVTRSASAETAFITLAQANHQLDSGLASSTTSITGKFSTLGKTLLPLKTSLNGVGQASLQLQQQFQQSVADAQPLIDALRAANLPAGDFTHGLKAIVGQLIPFAKGSKAATAQLLLLAMQGNYTGAHSLAGLVQWIGKTNISAAALKKITDLATRALSNLDKQAAALNTSLQQNIISTMTNAAIATSGVSAATTAYTKSLLNNGATAASTQSRRATLVKDLENIGYSAKRANDLVDALNKTLGRTPRNDPSRISVTGTGTWSVTGGGSTVTGPSPGGTHLTAAGWLVSGGTPGVDSVPILAMPGETVVPRHLTPAIAPLMAAHGVPGFAQGGVVGHYGPGSVAGLGPWVTGEYGQTVQAIQAATAAATAAGMKAAAAAATTGLGGTAGPGGGAPAANAALARRLFPGWGSGIQWAAWNAVAMRESGWNQFARNAASGAYGIPQALPESKLPFAGQSAGGSNPAAQIGWMAAYMGQRYGSPLGAMAHENAFGWYDKGGWLPRGLSLALNTTGHPERVGGAQKIVLEVHGGHGEFDQFMVKLIKKYVRVAGGGDVQVALG